MKIVRCRFAQLLAVFFPVNVFQMRLKSLHNELNLVRVIEKVNYLDLRVGRSLEQRSPRFWIKW